MANYYIGIDENGQPYIAHASTDAGYGGANKQRFRYRAKAKAKKYLQKVQDYYGKGKNLYLYTQDQVRAFANRGKKKVKEIAGDAALNARGFARTVKNKAGKVKDRAVDKAKDVALNARGLARTVGYKANQAKNRAVEKAKDKLGYDERERLLEAQMRYQHELGNQQGMATAGRNSRGGIDAHQKALENAEKQYLDAIEEYLKTPLGKKARRNGFYSVAGLTKGAKK